MGYHWVSLCRGQNKCLKVLGSGKAEGRENISWLWGIKLLFQKLLKCTNFFHLVENQQCEYEPSSYLLGLPAFLLLRLNSGEINAPALVPLLRSHQGHPVVLPSQQSPERIETTLDWCVPFCLRRLVCRFGSRWSRSDWFLCFFRNRHHSIFGFLQPGPFLSRSFITPTNLHSFNASNPSTTIIRSIHSWPFFGRKRFFFLLFRCRRWWWRRILDNHFAAKRPKPPHQTDAQE